VCFYLYGNLAAQCPETNVLTIVPNAKVISAILTFMAAYGRHFFNKNLMYINDVTRFVTVFLSCVINVLFRKNRSRFFCVELRFTYANDVAER
jgi:hypothetical protein